MLKQWWSKAQEQLPQLREQLNDQINHLNQTVTPWISNLVGGSGDVIQVGQHRLVILSKLGEGGYSFVYLAEEIPANPGTTTTGFHQDQPRRRYALKKVLASEAEQLAAAQKEIDIMRQLPPHPSLLPLLDSQIIQADQGQGRYIIYMLFPLMVSLC